MKNRNFKSAKYQLTVLLPKEIHYGHTIDEAEKVDAISDAMELYAEEKGVEFALFIAENGWRNIGNSEWSNGEIHRTTSEIYNMFHVVPTVIDIGLNVVLDNKHENDFKLSDLKYGECVHHENLASCDICNNRGSIDIKSIVESPYVYFIEHSQKHSWVPNRGVINDLTFDPTLAMQFSNELHAKLTLNEYVKNKDLLDEFIVTEHEFTITLP